MKNGREPLYVIAMRLHSFPGWLMFDVGHGETQTNVMNGRARKSPSVCRRLTQTADNQLSGIYVDDLRQESLRHWWRFVVSCTKVKCVAADPLSRTMHKRMTCERKRNIPQTGTYQSVRIIFYCCRRCEPNSYMDLHIRSGLLHDTLGRVTSQQSLVLNE